MPNQPLPSSRPEQWLAQRLANVAEFDPHFEASWYGPYNALLSHSFPYQQRFLIKTQPKIRAPYAEDGDFSFSSIQVESSMVMDEPAISPDVSVISMGGLAMHGASTFIPDFIVAKATEFASHDKALLLVEVKVREPETQSASRKNDYQMDRYMNAIAEQISEDTKVIGLLICGTDVNVSRVEGPGSRAQSDGSTHDINSTTIRQLLLNIAEGNWDY